MGPLSLSPLLALIAAGPFPIPGFTVDPVVLGQVTVRLAIAFLFTLPIGREREQDDRSAGVRTFPLVAMASCGYVLIAVRLFGVTADTQVHLLQGLITGIGFIGGGAIVKDQEHVRGTATAAGIWATSMIGAAIGYGQLELAFMVSAATFATLRIMTKLRRRGIGRGDTKAVSQGDDGT